METSDVCISLNDPTYGIESDKLAQFAAIFSALIHDVDHRGVPNFILAREQVEMAERYRGRAVAEQNSVAVAWDLLMKSEFEDLRACIYTTQDELRRFRQLVVNTVMATDIFDPTSAKIRKDRWNQAFDNDQSAEAKTMDDVSRKATIVIEHLIQASDVAHTMQHWVGPSCRMVAIRLSSTSVFLTYLISL
jgi:hypothetical protein